VGVPGLLLRFLSFLGAVSCGSSVMVKGLSKDSLLLPLPAPLLRLRLALPVLLTLLPRLTRSLLLSPGIISSVPSSM